MVRARAVYTGRRRRRRAPKNLAASRSGSLTHIRAYEDADAPRLLALALLELALDAVQLRRRPIQPPPVAHQRDRRRQGDPDRPERALGAGRQPDRGAQQERAEQPAGLLQEPPLELAPPRRERRPLLLARGRERRQVGAQGAELSVGARRVRGGDAFVELVLGQPPGGEVVADLGDRALALLVGGAEVGRVGHDPYV